MATLEWTEDGLRLIDQTRLPEAEVHVLCRTAPEIAAAIRTMAVRGAPAIGVAAGYGAALARSDTELEELRSARPTARDLFWALERVTRAGDRMAEAHAIARESLESSLAMGRHGAALIHPGARIVTICNTGALAAVDYGTALSAVRIAHEEGKRPFVYALETRPRAQGAKLTAWELQRLGIPFRLIADGAAGILLRRGMVDLALSGADRVCANGDVVNKVGTYPLALVCRANDIPFYVVAPCSTLDPATRNGDEVVIEERDESEVTTFAPAGTRAWNPAFDVTPSALVTLLVTENGVR